ncbi:MAG TPA: hypothetical protein VLG76_07135 [Rhabdochlamydiaceae bacterium]|nr:hypothetical protein [Rhabdochlamydiaceae bacterium]
MTVPTLTNNPLLSAYVSPLDNQQEKESSSAPAPTSATTESSSDPQADPQPDQFSQAVQNFQLQQNFSRNMQFGMYGMSLAQLGAANLFLAATDPNPLVTQRATSTSASSITSSTEDSQSIPQNVSKPVATPSSQATPATQSSAPKVSQRQRSDFWTDEFKEVTIYQQVLVAFEMSNGEKEISDILEEFNLPLEKFDPIRIKNYIYAMADYWDRIRCKRACSLEEISNKWKVDQTILEKLLIKAAVRSCKQIYYSYLQKKTLAQKERSTSSTLQTTSTSSSSITSSTPNSQSRSQKAPKGKRKEPATAIPVVIRPEVSKKQKSGPRNTLPYERIILDFRKSEGLRPLSDILKEDFDLDREEITRAYYRTRSYIRAMVACVHEEQDNIISKRSDRVLRKYCTNSSLAAQRLLDLLPEARQHITFYKNYLQELGELVPLLTQSSAPEVAQRQTSDFTDLFALADAAVATDPNLDRSTTSITSPPQDSQSKPQQLSKKQKLAIKEEKFKKVIKAFQESGGKRDLCEIIETFGLGARMNGPITRNIKAIAACMHHEDTHPIISDESDADLKKFCSPPTSPKKVFSLLPMARPCKAFYVEYYKSNNLEKKSITNN